MWVIQFNIVDWGYFKTQTLLETWKIQNQPRGESCASLEVDHLFRMCKKRQTSVSHFSTESEIVPLDAGLRMDGIPALDLWDVVIEALHSSINNTPPTQKNSANEGRTKGAAGNCLRISNVRLRRESNQNAGQLSNLDHVTTNANSSQCEAQLYNF